MTTLNEQSSNIRLTGIDSAARRAAPPVNGVRTHRERAFGVPIQDANIVDGLSSGGSQLGLAQQKDAMDAARRVGLEMKSATAAVLALKGYEDGRPLSARASQKTQRKRVARNGRTKAPAVGLVDAAGATVPGGSALSAAIQSASGASV